jgi:predicted metal-binding membrane protein
MTVADRIRRMGGAHWLGFFALVLGAWALLFAMQVPADLRAAASFYGADLWAALCSIEPGLAGAPTLFAMWAAMAAAMMAPSFLPALATYDDLSRTAAVGRAGFAALLGGYLAVWLGFAALATVAQIALTGAGLLTPLGESASRGLSAGLLALAGIYQFSPLKHACLSRCRHPLGFFMQHWSPGSAAAVGMGLRLGLVCLGCCWALMALAFVGGTMNLAWMGLAMVLMTLEKLPAPGRILTRPLGLALLVAAPVALII